jgi:integrase
MRYYRQALGPVLEKAGGLRLEKLNPLLLTNLFAELRRAGRGTRAIQQAYTVLGTCLRQAVKLGTLGSNPLDRVDKPTHQPGEPERWKPDQVARFLEVAAQSRHRYAPLFTVLVATGLRIGEALGLRWEDVDLRAGTLTVRRAYVYAGNEGTIQPTKTRAGQRVISLPEQAMAAFQRIPRPLDTAAPVFTTSNGTIPTQSDLRKALQRLCRRAGVLAVTIHGLRHVHAALLADQGLDAHTLKQRMGHTRVSTTMDLYAYAMRSDGAATDAFQRAVGNG